MTAFSGEPLLSCFQGITGPDVGPFLMMPCGDHAQVFRMVEQVGKLKRHHQRRITIGRPLLNRASTFWLKQLASSFVAWESLVSQALREENSSNVLWRQIRPGRRVWPASG